MLPEYQSELSQLGSLLLESQPVSCQPCSALLESQLVSCQLGRVFACSAYSRKPPDLNKVSMVAKR